MATTGPTFPPGVPSLTGITSSLLNQNGVSGPTVMFTAAVAGLYWVQGATRLVSTNNAGSMGTVFSRPAGGGGTQLINFMSANPNVAPGLDSNSAGTSLWMEAGQTLTCVVTASGLTGTIFNVFLTVLHVL